MPQATIKLKCIFPPSFPSPQILLVQSLLKTIPKNSKSHFFLDPPRQIPVCRVLEEGQSLAVPGVLWCPALEETARDGALCQGEAWPGSCSCWDPPSREEQAAFCKFSDRHKINRHWEAPLFPAGIAVLAPLSYYQM